MISFHESARAAFGTLAVTAATLVCLACGSSGADDGTTTDSAKTCAPDTTPASALATPVVSFEVDVAPIFARSCAFSSCHGSHGVGNQGVFLGANGTDGIAAVKKALLAPSQELPSMNFVTPGDPDNSFVMRKLDGSTCGLDAQCVGKTCGTSMPQGNDLLPQEQRDTVRRWISQGAK